MIRIEYDDNDVRAALGGLVARMDDLTPAMQEIGEYLAEATKQRFQAGTAPDGTVWAPKTEATKAAQARRGDRPDPRPLIWRRALSSRIFYEAGPDGVEVGSPEIYAATMHFGAAQGAFGANARGAPIPWGDIPARPFLGLSADDRTAVIDIVAEWLETAAAGGG